MSSPHPNGTVSSAPRLLDLVRQACQAHFGRPEPGERYADWVRQYVVFHGKRHPRELGVAEIVRFLRHVGLCRPNELEPVLQAHEALVFLYKEVLLVDLGEVLVPPPPRVLVRLRWVPPATLPRTFGKFFFELG